MWARDGLIQVTGWLEVLVWLYGCCNVHSIVGQSHTTEWQQHNAHVHTAHVGFTHLQVVEGKYWAQQWKKPLSFTFFCLLQQARCQRSFFMLPHPQNTSSLYPLFEYALPVWQGTINWPPLVPIVIPPIIHFYYPHDTAVQNTQHILLKRYAFSWGQLDVRWVIAGTLCHNNDTAHCHIETVMCP